MDDDTLFRTIQDLRRELEQIDHAIRQIEALEKGRGLRGRPPRAVAAAREQASAVKSRIPVRSKRRRQGRSGDNDG